MVSLCIKLGYDSGYLGCTLCTLKLYLFKHCIFSIYVFIYSFIYLCILLFIHLFIYLFIYLLSFDKISLVSRQIMYYLFSFIYLFIHLLIYLFFIYSFIYLSSFEIISLNTRQICEISRNKEQFVIFHGLESCWRY